MRLISPHSACRTCRYRSPLPYRSLVLGAVALAGLATASPLFSQTPDGIAAALKQPILAPGQAEKEVADYCEARVPRMPELRSRSDWQATAEKLRKEALKRAVFRGEAERWRRYRGRVVWLETLPGGPGYHLRKLRYEALPGLWIPAVLYEPDNLKGRVPVVLNVNGHDRNGKAAEYKQLRCINLAKRGMLALNAEWLGMGQLREGDTHDRINAIDLTGTSGLATHFLAMTRALDLLLAHPHADPKRVAVAGLSGGGWQTITISALDPRVTLSNPVAGYSSFRTRARHFSDLGDSEQTPVDLASVVDYTHLTAFRAPRPTLLTFNAQDDCCFRADHALQPLLDAAAPAYRLFGRGEALRTHVNTVPGTHNFLQDNREAFYRMLGDHFFPGDATYRREEIPSEGELKSAAQLDIPLPAEQKTLQSLALELAAKLPRRREESPSAARKRLRELVRLREVGVHESHQVIRKDGEKLVIPWSLRVGDWTIPALQYGNPDARSTVLVCADAGKASVEEIVRVRASRGERVIVYDPFGIGEQNTGRYNYLWALFLSSLGERPLGVSASQMLAVAQWAKKTSAGPVQVVTVGPRTGVTAMIAAALDTDAIGDLELWGAAAGLKEVLTRQTPFADAPELFCFGLLKEFEVPDLVRLAAPRQVVLRSVKQTTHAPKATSLSVDSCACSER